MLISATTFTNDCQPSFLISRPFNYYGFLFLQFVYLPAINPLSPVFGNSADIFFHCSGAAHAIKLLEFLSISFDELPPTLVVPRQHPPHHHQVGPRTEGLCDVPGAGAASILQKVVVIFFSFEGLYFQESFIWKTSILKSGKLKEI